MTIQYLRGTRQEPCPPFGDGRVFLRSPDAVKAVGAAHETARLEQDADGPIVITISPRTKDDSLSRVADRAVVPLSALQAFRASLIPRGDSA